MGYIYSSKPFSQSGFNYAQGSGQPNIGLANILEPNDEFRNLVDVIQKFNWTYTPMNETTVKEVPYIKLREFYLLESYWNQLFKAYGRTIPSNFNLPSLGAALLNPLTLNENSELLYQGLYDHVNPTGFTYKFPYFSENYLNTNNSWTSKPMFEELLNMQVKFTGVGAAIAAGAFGGILGLITGGSGGALAGAQFAAKYTKLGMEKTLIYDKTLEIAGIGKTSPVSFGKDPAIDKPHLWSTTTPRSFTVTFPLFNTITNPENKKWYENIIKNWELCHLLCYQNLYNKRNLFTGIPPVFYEIDIPGVHYSKAGYVSNLQILNAGNIRKLTLPLGVEGGSKEVNVPDAYIINMTVTDFFMPSKNFMSSLCINSENKSSSLVGSNEGEPFDVYVPPPATRPVITPAGPITPDD